MAEHPPAVTWRELNRVLFVTAAAGAIWFLRAPEQAYIIPVGVACALVGGFAIFHEAYENIFHRRITIKLIMAIAIITALSIRKVFTALVITDFVLAAEILHGRTAARRAGSGKKWTVK
jgi:cation transport ATPase